MDNYIAIEKLSKSFVNFLESAKLTKYDYKQIEGLTTQQKLSFISTYLKPHKNRLDLFIIENFEKRGDKLENYRAEDIDKLKKYLEAFLECV